jgi:hypothetical protein
MAGTYTQRFALEPGGMACPTLFDQTLTITPKAVTNGAHDAGPPGTGSDCSWTVDASSCMLTTSCTLSANGFTTRASGTIAFVGAEGSGKESVRISDAGGDVLSSCAYDITMTRVQGPQ